MRSLKPETELRFEGPLPREFFLPKKPAPVIRPKRQVDWRTVCVSSVLAAGFVVVLTIANREGPIPPQVPLLSAPVPVQPIPAPTPPKSAPTPAPVHEDEPPDRLVQRAQLVEPIVRRALPIEGNLYVITMPDGSHPLIRYMGAVHDFANLPKNPNLWDLYQIASSGHSWVFMQPAGFSAPSWVDP